MTYIAAFELLHERGIPLVSVNGPIDVNNACAFAAVVRCAEQSESPAIIVVLPSSDYVCARAYGILAGTYRRLKAADRKLLVVCPPAAFARRIITRLCLPFELFASVADAVKVVPL